ncbi:MAG: hypothetical protein AAGE80_06830 [Pseudomonadota bacterium]
MKLDGVRPYRRISLWRQFLDRLFQTATIVGATGTVLITVLLLTEQ